jgi:hypothetical protein
MSYVFSIAVYDAADLRDYIVNKLAKTPTRIILDGSQTTIKFASALTTGEQSSLTSLMNDYVNTNANTGTWVSGVAKQVASQNSTMAPLTSLAVYTGIWRDVSNVDAIAFTCKADVSGSITLQFGVLRKEVDFFDTFDIPANQEVRRIFSVKTQFFRIVYTNGASNQASFFLLTTVHEYAPANLISLGDTLVNDSYKAELGRSVVCARTSNNAYKPLLMNERGMLLGSAPDNKFELAETLDNLFHISFTYGIADLLATTTLTASGTATSSSSLAVLTTGTSTVSSSSLSSRRYIHCLPGQTATLIVSGIFGTPASGCTQLLGAGTSANGLFVGYNSLTFGICIRSNSADTWITMSNFNIDVLDGTGDSGVTLNPQTGNTYMIVYDTTGFGTVAVSILHPGSSTNSRKSGLTSIHAHQQAFNNSSTTIGILKPHFPASAMLTKTSGSTNTSMKVASISAYLSGLPHHQGLTFTAENVVSIGLKTYVPLLCIRNRSTFNSITNVGSAKLMGVGCAIQAVRKNVLLAIYKNATITGGTWANVDTNNSVMEQSTDSIAFTGGTSLWRHCTYSSDVEASLSNLDIVLSPGESIVIAGRNAIDTTSVMSCSLSWVEMQ